MPNNIPSPYVKGFGLLPLPPDARDFPHAQVFGAAAPADLPSEYLVGMPLTVKDQGGKDFCAGYASTEVSEFQELIELNPDFAFMIAKYLMGPEAWKSWGIDLRSMCKGHTEVGCIEQQQFPFTGDDRAGDRNFLANWENWRLEEMKLLAVDHKKESYWDADTGGSDRFDNLRSTLYVNRAEERAIITGMLWRPSWTAAPGGVIPEMGWENEQGTGHAIMAFGWVLKNGMPHLAILNSWGEDKGDHGVFYFPRSVVNSQFTFGAFTFKDVTKEESQYYVDYGITIFDGLLTKIWKVLKTIVLGLFKRSNA